MFAIRSGFIACCIILSACGGGSSSDSDNSSAPADNSELTIIGETEVAAQSTQILLAQDNSDSATTAPWQWTVVSGQSLLETAEVDEERFQYRSVALNGPASIRVRVQRQAADGEPRSAETSIQLRPANDTAMAPRVDAGSDKVADEGEEITLYSSVTAAVSEPFPGSKRRDRVPRLLAPVTKTAFISACPRLSKMTPCAFV